MAGLKKINQQDDIYHYVAEECKVDYKLVKLIERNFFHTIYSRLKDPLIEKRDITVEGFFKFKMNLYRLPHVIKNTKKEWLLEMATQIQKLWVNKPKKLR